jgi:L-amino acid N-acyltransferase YncA
MSLRARAYPLTEPPPRRPEREAVRQASTDDLEALANLRVAFWLDQSARGLLDYHPLDAESIGKETRSILGRPRTVVLVTAREGGSATGYAYGQMKIIPGAPQSRVAMIEEIYADPDLASASTAFSLMRAMVDALREAGADRIQGKVLDQNAKSKEFHELLGFQLNLLIYEYIG